MKQSKRKLPLRVYLAAGFLIFSALLLVVLWLFQTVFLETFYKSVKTGQVKSCAYSVADNLESSGLSDLITDIEEQNSMTVAIFDTESTIFTTVYSSKTPSQRFKMEMSAVYEMYNLAVEQDGEYSSITRTGNPRRFDWDGKDYRIVTATPDSAEPPFQNINGDKDDRDDDLDDDRDDDFDDDRDDIFDDDRDDNNGFNNRNFPSLERENVETLTFVKVVATSSGERLVIVESEITPVSSVVDTLRYQLIIMTVVLVVLSVIMAVFVSNMISKPISVTNEKAKALADRNYDLHFSGGRYREIKELNDTLNYAADELMKVDNLQKELIANISHDLRTPLTMITGYAEIMRDLPGEVTPENIQIIIDEATRLNNLVSDLLDISRLQSGTADIKRAPFSLTNCIKSIFSRYTKLVESDGLNIVFEHDGEVFVNGDELRMTQVIYNLINNAINYIGDDKTVLVRQTAADGRVKIEVIDHGDGIPQEKLDYIWDRYYRVEKEHKRAVIGTGLGLSIVKNILIAHDADFGVASKLGEGSDFYFSMPIIDTEE